MATVLTYGTVQFSDIKTKTLVQKPIFTEDGSHYLFDEYTISIKAVFALGLDPAEAGETAAQTWARIKGCLSKPRQQLTFTDSGNTLIFSPAAMQTTDAKNGPMPGPLNVVMLSPGSYLVEYSITTWTYNCCEGANPNAYITHRWTESQSIDDKDFRSVVTRKGRLSFSSELLIGATAPGTAPWPTADAFRNLITLKCPLRERCLRHSEYTVTSDGLNIDYTITDKEQYAMPLDGLTRFEAEYRLNIMKEAILHPEMIVRVWGSNLASKNTLFQAAMTILLARLAPGSASFAAAGVTLLSGYVLDRLHENYVEIGVKLFTTDTKSTFYGLVASTTRVFPSTGGVSTIDPLSSTGFSPINPTVPPLKIPDPQTYATLGLMLVSAAFNDPCLDTWLTDVGYCIPSPTCATGAGATAMMFGAGSTSGETPIDCDTPVSQFSPADITVVATLPTFDTNLVTAELSSGSYINSVMDIGYEQDQHVVQMPVASSGTTSASFAYLAQPTMKKTVTYVIEKSGAQPTLPATVSTDANEILLWTDIRPNAVQLEADNITTTWRVSGKYIYGITDPTVETLNAGRNPYVDVTYASTVISSGQFVGGLTSP